MNDIAELETLTTEVIARAHAEAELLEYSALDRTNLARLRAQLEAVIQMVTHFVATEGAFGGGTLSARMIVIVESLVMGTDTAADALEALRSRRRREAEICARDLEIILAATRETLVDTMRALPFSDAVVRDFQVLDRARAALAEQRMLADAIDAIVQRKS